MNKKYKQYLIHIGLFVVTFITTTLAGSFWVNNTIWPYTSYSWSDFVVGMQYSIPFLTILTVHEFGHYFTAKYHKVKTSLPYYIPLPPFPALIGTMGAIIRIRQFVKSQKQNFDIGLSGPLAGFIIAIGVLAYGFTHLPDKDHILELHPEYAYFGEDYEKYVYTTDTFALTKEVERITGKDMSSYPDTIRFNSEQQQGISVQLGSNLVFWFFEEYVADQSKLPNRHEMMHYPLLFAGFLALLFTAINLLPIGQLDGGHVLYGLIGHKWHRWVAMSVFILFVFYAGLGLITPFDKTTGFLGMSLPASIVFYVGFLFLTFKGLRLSNVNTIMVALLVFTVQFTLPMLFKGIEGYSGWLLFAFLIGRFLGIYHPITPIEEPLDQNRKILGWIALVIFLISFSPAPLIVA